MPSRPSGADKEKERARNEDGSGLGHSGRPIGRAELVPRRHALEYPHPRRQPGGFWLNPHYRRRALLLAESRGPNQRPNTSALLSFEGRKGECRNVPSPSPPMDAIGAVRIGSGRAAF